MAIDRRVLIGGAGATLAVSALSLPSARADESAPLPRLIAEDYASARRHFRTHLLRQGPAPDMGDPLDAPESATAVRYRSQDLDLVAWVASPATAGPHPAVLFLHGGNALWHGHWDLTLPYRSAGYVAMMPSMRAENGQPGAFSGFYDETDDVLAAADFLSKRPDVDRSRLFLAGHSVGGTLVLLAAMASPIFRAATSFSANPDAGAFFRHFPEDIRFDAGDAAEIEMRSAVCYAPSFKCPVRIFHGSQETRSHASTQLTVDRARGAELDVESDVIEGDHFSAIPGETERSLRFFATLL